MPYDSIPGVRASYEDGAFRSNAASTQPRILILGTAASGLTYELYRVGSVAAAAIAGFPAIILGILTKVLKELVESYWGNPGDSK